MRIVFCQLLLVLALKSVPAGAAAEEFKYYVWIDDQGIVHAEEEPPKGVDYQVRIIEDVNANVVPAEDFRVYEEPHGGFGSQPQAREPRSAAEPDATGD